MPRIHHADEPLHHREARYRLRMEEALARREKRVRNAIEHPNLHGDTVRVPLGYATVSERDRFTFGATLRAFRARYKMSQVELSRRLGITRSRLANWELGHHPVPYRLYAGLVKALRGQELAEMQREKHSHRKAQAKRRRSAGVDAVELGKWDSLPPDASKESIE